MLKSFLFLVLSFLTLSLQAQYGGPRLFLDVPSFYLHSPNVEKLTDRTGAGIDVAMNVGTHWGVARVGAGTTFTFEPKSEKFNETTVWGPFAFMEAGAGMYRSNGNQCAKQHQSAFTALGKVGLRYDFNDAAVPVKNLEDKPNQLDFTLGVELGYFFIADEFRNMEFVLSGQYRTQAQVVMANVGFKFFLNLRARH